MDKTHVTEKIIQERRTGGTWKKNEEKGAEDKDI